MPRKKTRTAPSRLEKGRPPSPHTISCVFDTTNARNDEIVCLTKADHKTFTEDKLLNWCFAFPRFAPKTRGLHYLYYLGESAVSLAQTSEIAWIPTNHGKRRRHFARHICAVDENTDELVGNGDGFRHDLRHAWLSVCVAIGMRGYRHAQLCHRGHRRIPKAASLQVKSAKLREEQNEKSPSFGENELSRRTNRAGRVRKRRPGASF